MTAIEYGKGPKIRGHDGHRLVATLFIDGVEAHTVTASSRAEAASALAKWARDNMGEESE